jgi:hypothetical protein
MTYLTQPEIDNMTDKKRGQPAKPWQSKTVRCPLPCLAQVILVINQFKSSMKRAPGTITPDEPLI